VVAEGSRLLRGTLSAEIQGAEAGGLILEGFLPLLRSRRNPAPRRTNGVQELGLLTRKKPPHAPSRRVSAPPCRGGFHRAP